MKKILSALIITISLSAFNITNGLTDVVEALKVGNANSVSKYFDNTVEISLSGKSNNYSKSQGEIILKDFFTNNTVKSFTVIHQGAAGDSEFCIGTLVTQRGNFRTTLNLKQKGDKKVLQEIKFEN